MSKQSAELLKYLLAKLKNAPAAASTVVRNVVSLVLSISFPLSYSVISSPLSDTESKVDGEALLRIVKMSHPRSLQENNKNKETLALLRSELSGRHLLLA